MDQGQRASSVESPRGGVLSLREGTDGRIAETHADHPILPSEVREFCAISAHLMAGLRTLQAAYLSQLPSPTFRYRTSALTGRSFLLTAAGQFRNLTGFPIKPDFAIGYREVKRLYQAYSDASTAIYRGTCAYLEIAASRGKRPEFAAITAIRICQAVYPRKNFWLTRRRSSEQQGKKVAVSSENLHICKESRPHC